jgi:hypothetical protein
MTMTINGTSGLVFNDASTQNTAATGFGFKNRIINGAMMIDQRNAGASFNVQGGEYSVDRWATNASQTSKFSAQQNAGSVTPPTGYTNYLGLTSLAATTVGSSDVFNVAQYVEGLNCADLGWGTASASTVTLSFWVRSSLTGTFGGSLTNSNVTRSYPFSYTISAANTWEQKSITITGDTTGTWLTTNGIGIRLYFSLGTGSTRATTAGAWAAGDYRTATGATSVVGTNGATFYITGVQLEKGSTATSFDYRPYGTELALCQRYYQNIGRSAGNEVVIGGYGVSGTYIYYTYSFPVQMRAVPTMTKVGTWYTSNTGQPTISGVGNQSVAFSALGTGTGNQVTASDVSTYYTASAEL